MKTTENKHTMKTLIRNAEYKGQSTDILIEGKKIARIAPSIDVPADKVLDATGKAVSPGLVNMHTHLPMTLFRSFADDMELMPWLTQKIWPNEARMTDEMYYWGGRLGCLEMIKTGTTCFNDQYMNLPVVSRAADDSGMRAFVCSLIMDPGMQMTPAQAIEKIEKDFASAPQDLSDRITLTIGTHAIYTVPEAVLREVARYARAHGLLIHMHSSETKGEVENCLSQHGMRPVEWLDSIGFLGDNVILAHSLWLSENEIRIMAEKGVKAVRVPLSNLKLASGYEFRYEEMKAAGVQVGLGTDGNSSANNLDMLETMKMTSLIDKAWRFDPTTATAKDMFACATCNAADMLGIPAGRLEEGCLADLVLWDLNTPAFTPNYNFVSNLVFSANGYCADTVLCDGRVLMENRHVEGEEEIMAKVNELAKAFV